MSHNKTTSEYSADIKLWKSSIKVLDDVADCLFIVPVSLDAAQISRQVWETTQKSSSTEAARSMQAQQVLKSMAVMIRKVHSSIEEHLNFLRKHWPLQLAVDLVKLCDVIAMISSSSADAVYCRIAMDTINIKFQFLTRMDSVVYDIGEITRELKTEAFVSISRDSFEKRWRESQHYMHPQIGKEDSGADTDGHTPSVIRSNIVVESDGWLPDLTGQIARDDTAPFARGRIADYWKGIWHHGTQTCKVVVKTMRRLHYDSVSDYEKDVCYRAWRRDLQVWRRLHHQNIIPLLGIVSETKHNQCIISSWAEKGDLNRFLRYHSDELYVSDRLQMLVDIASGLTYLHSISIIHGNLAGYRILIDEGKIAYISGFDCSTILTDPDDPELYNPHDDIDIHLPWAAPERVVVDMGGAAIVSTQNDIFSFGRIMLQILSGKFPFHEVPSHVLIYDKIINGIHPQRPSESWVTDDHWMFIKRCWADYVSGERPAVTEVLEYVKTELMKFRQRQTEILKKTDEHRELLDLTGCIQRESEFPSAGGGFADIWKATWRQESITRTVAVKVLRHHINDEYTGNKLDKRLRRELRVWRKLGDHPNVLPLYGIASDFGYYPSLVCPWLDNGNLNFYLERKGVALSICDRLEILVDVAAGLSHLHSFEDPVIHGDLTGSNILVDANGKASLCDFGLSAILAEFHGTSYFTSTVSGSVRWAAPELYRIEDGVIAVGLSTESDMYSYGSIMLQVLSGEVPYQSLQNLQVLHQLVHGHYPERPSTQLITDEHWQFMVRCWASNGKLRPQIEEAHRYVLNHSHAEEKIVAHDMPEVADMMHVD